MLSNLWSLRGYTFECCATLIFERWMREVPEDWRKTSLQKGQGEPRKAQTSQPHLPPWKGSAYSEGYMVPWCMEEGKVIKSSHLWWFGPSWGPDACQSCSIISPPYMDRGEGKYSKKPISWDRRHLIGLKTKAMCRSKNNFIPYFPSAGDVWSLLGSSVSICIIILEDGCYQWMPPHFPLSLSFLRLSWHHMVWNTLFSLDKLA